MNFGSHSRLHIDMALKARGKTKHTCTEPSEAFPVNDGWARLIVLSLGDPHLLEGAQGRKDGATDPHRVLALRWYTTLIFMVEGAKAESSFVMRSPMPANIVVPPERTTLP